MTTDATLTTKGQTTIPKQIADRRWVLVCDPHRKGGPQQQAKSLWKKFTETFGEAIAAIAIRSLSATLPVATCSAATPYRPPRKATPSPYSSGC